MKRGTVLFGLVLLIARGAAAAPVPGSQAPGYTPPPASFTTADGRTWVRVPLQYTDVQAIARMLGAPVLPTEMDVWNLRMRAWMSRGAFGGGYGGWASAPGGYAVPLGMGGGFGPALYGGGSPSYGGNGYAGGPAYNGTPAAGAYYRATNGSAYAFLPVTGGNPAGSGSGMPAGRAILGDRNSDSLLVGPEGRSNPAGMPLFPGLIIFGDRGTNSLLVDP